MDFYELLALDHDESNVLHDLWDEAIGFKDYSPVFGFGTKNSRLFSYEKNFWLKTFFVNYSSFIYRYAFYFWLRIPSVSKAFDWGFSKYIDDLSRELSSFFSVFSFFFKFLPGKKNAVFLEFFETYRSSIHWIKEEIRPEVEVRLFAPLFINELTSRISYSSYYMSSALNASNLGLKSASFINYYWFLTFFLAGRLDIQKFTDSSSTVSLFNFFPSSDAKPLRLLNFFFFNDVEVFGNYKTSGFFYTPFYKQLYTSLGMDDKSMHGMGYLVYGINDTTSLRNPGLFLFALNSIGYDIEKSDLVEKKKYLSENFFKKKLKVKKGYKYPGYAYPAVPKYIYKSDAVSSFDHGLSSQGYFEDYFMNSWRALILKPSERTRALKEYPAILFSKTFSSNLFSSLQTYASSIFKVKGFDYKLYNFYHLQYSEAQPCVDNSKFVESASASFFMKELFQRKAFTFNTF
eukprot:TRINITY_DN2490_c0_g1_i1.p1 TRINITY_DN2490_c0_g1~~TRINITY_DN2490_c0_g1_i1.p1  ORF type:complete len:460 (+),score=10.89 TRINITY_DN2490_c0_g1_i1:823-2202(+)